MGREEGMTNVGEGRDEALGLDRDRFRGELLDLMDPYDELDALVFFKLVHVAYERVLGNNEDKQVLFYHIHNPNTYAKLNFTRLAPKAKWMMMVREPIQSCESWVQKCFLENDYLHITNRIVTMLFDVDHVLYRDRDCVGVRLEDLKEHPKRTMVALCDWMGICEEESLYEMTAQGKKWWGDPTSPDFGKRQMSPFGKSSINRKLGSVFSEADQFVLHTLFYPFSVRFGYIEENLDKFKDDLHKVRPMLDNLFDFERLIIERTDADSDQFIRSGSYQYLRVCMLERWNILNEFQTYPHMLKPLSI
tara:strand:- start:53 stop:967 length:915 start_codon:yes stop_codon:yes gene_type:complete